MICPKCKEDGYEYCSLRRRNECLYCGFTEDEEEIKSNPKPIAEVVDKNPKGG